MMWSSNEKMDSLVFSSNLLRSYISHGSFSKIYFSICCSLDQWLWLDNSAVDFVNWEEKETSVEHNCVEMTAPFGYWAITDCSSEKGFICKKNKGKSLGIEQICLLVAIVLLYNKSVNNFWWFGLAYPTFSDICNCLCLQ